MNKVILMGRLARDPEIRYTQSGEPMAVARYAIAVDRRIKKEGEPTADFINCVAFGKAGEFAEKYFKKGMQVAVSGRMQNRQWDTPDGVRHYATDVILDDQEFAESKAAFEHRMANTPRETYAPAPARQPSAPAVAPYEPEGFSTITETMNDDDLPF